MNQRTRVRPKCPSFLIALVVSLSAAGGQSNAAECRHLHLAEAVEDAELVFAGTALRIEWTQEVPSEPGPSPSSFPEAVTFAVERTWFGSAGQQVVVYNRRRGS